MTTELSYTAQATAREGPRPSVGIEGADLDLELNTPEPLGGAGGPGTNAEQLLAAGYAACLLSALRLAALARGVEIGDAEVRCTLDLRGRDGRFEASARLQVDIPSLPGDVAQALLDAACAAWPYAPERGDVRPQAELARGSGSAGGDDVAARQEAADGAGYA